MDKMSKKIKKLEKETLMWRQKWEASQKSLLEMAEQKTRGEKDISLLQNKLSKLEGLCRALQEERKRAFTNPTTTSVESTLDHTGSAEVTPTFEEPSVNQVPSLSPSVLLSDPPSHQISDKNVPSNITSNNDSPTGAAVSKSPELQACGEISKEGEICNAVTAGEACSEACADGRAETAAGDSVSQLATSQTAESLDTDNNIDSNHDTANKDV